MKFSHFDRGPGLSVVFSLGLVLFASGCPEKTGQGEGSEVPGQGGSDAGSRPTGDAPPKLPGASPLTPPASDPAVTPKPKLDPETRARDRDPEEERRKMSLSKERSKAAAEQLKKGNIDRAIAEAREALKIHEQNVEAMLVMAEAFYRQGKHEIVQSVTTSALTVDPKLLTAEETSRAHNLKGFAFLQDGKRQSAMLSFRRAADSDAKNASAWNNLGVQYMWAGDHATAASCFKYAHEVDPGFVQAQLNHGAALRAEGKLVEAELAFRKVLEKSPNHPFAHFNLGLLYLDADPFPELETTARLNRAIQELTRYKELAVAGPQPKDPESPAGIQKAALGNELVSAEQAELYIGAAKKGLDREKRREERDAERKKKAERDAEKAAEKAAEKKAEPEPAVPAEKPAEKPGPQKPGEKTPEPAKPAVPEPAKPAPAPDAQKPGAPKPDAPKPDAQKPTPKSGGALGLGFREQIDFSGRALGPVESRPDDRGIPRESRPLGRKIFG